MAKEREDEEEEWLRRMFRRRSETSGTKEEGLVEQRSTRGRVIPGRARRMSCYLLLVMLASQFGTCYSTWGLAGGKQGVALRETAFVDAFAITCILLRLRGGAENDIPMDDPLRREAENAAASSLTNMSKQQLREELQKRGCDVLGAKSVLQIRLERILKEEDPAASAQAAPIGAGNVAQKVDQDMMDVDATGLNGAWPERD
eukprot:765873-Hanusia_phi.AAC.2